MRQLPYTNAVTPADGSSTPTTLTLIADEGVNEGNHLIIIFLVSNGFLIDNITDSEGHDWELLASAQPGTGLGLVAAGAYMENGLPIGGTVSVEFDPNFLYGMITGLEISGLRRPVIGSGISADDGSDGAGGQVSATTVTLIRNDPVVNGISPDFYIGAYGYECDRSVPPSYAHLLPSLTPGDAEVVNPPFYTPDRQIGMEVFYGPLTGFNFHMEGTLSTTLAPGVIPFATRWDLILLALKPEVGAGVALVTLSNNWLVRARNDGGVAKVDRSTNAGVSFGILQTIDNDADAGSSLSLYASPWDHVGLLYHNSDGALRVWRSDDWGSTWTDLGTQAGKTFASGAWQNGRLVVALFQSGTLRIFESFDFGATLSQIATISDTSQEVIQLRTDRADILHLVYRNPSGALLHRWSKDGVTWSSAETLQAGAASAESPAYAVGMERATYTYVQGGFPFGQRTTEGYGANSAAITMPAGITFEPVSFGLAYDGRDNLYLSGRDTNDVIQTRVSKDQGRTWSTPS